MSETRDIDLRLYEDSVAGVCKARPNTDPDQAGYYYASEDVVRLVRALRAQLAAAEREREGLDTFAGAVSYQLDCIAEHFDKDGNLLGDGKWRIDEILKYVKSIQEAERELIKAEESKPTKQGA